ncbi:MAG TPA: Uma2 family endonuclease [Tepidisphaeraceae bacterium]|jgi:Uma2 family endonuclease|nr:Uma2 family endonuclease [Tepidisphaeraceae bacterium]
MTVSSATSPAPAAPALENGDRLDQPTFHARYHEMPERFRAELIGGTVYVPSPLKADHGDIHGLLMTWLNLYRGKTSRTRVLDNATDILGNDSEPQPDACLVLEGGQTRLNRDGYLVGPPEFIAEVASSSQSYDLFQKREDYERYGVGEYLVVVVRESRVVWFVRPAGNQAASSYTELSPGPDGVFRSVSLPGLWLDPGALFNGDVERLVSVLNAGLATPEHVAFAARNRP